MKIPMRRLETNRLLLRKIQIADLKDFNEYAKKDNIGPRAGWMPHTSLSESEFILRDLKKKCTYAVISKENNKMIGTIGIHDTSLVGEKEIGYVLNDDFWNKGLMTEALQKILSYLFSLRTIESVIAGHFKENLSSKRVIEKCGFTLFFEGKDEKYSNYTDSVSYYRIDKEDYDRH